MALERRRQVNFTAPMWLVEALDQVVDGIEFTDRTHLILTALIDWLETNEPDLLEEYDPRT